MNVNKKILLIDDQEEILFSLKKLLSGEDSLRDLNKKMKLLINEFNIEEQSKEEIYDVHVALNGKSGYEMVKRAIEEGEPYSVVTIDMRMPGWDGLKTAKEIRKIDANIEMIIITAYTDIKREKMVEQIGKPEKLLYLKKPFEREEILQVILSLTLKWSLEQKVKNQLLIIENAKNTLEDVINGISEIEKSTLLSLNNVYKIILKELSKIFHCDKSAIILKNITIYSEDSLNYSEEIFDYEKLEKKLSFKRQFIIEDDILYINFYCEEEKRLQNKAIGVFKLNSIRNINEPVLDIFISHSNNLLKNSSLYSQLQNKNRELTLSNKKLKEADELNKKFLIISSHELRTPGTIISAYAELLSDGKVSDIRKVSKGLENAAFRLNFLIDQMLEVFATGDMKNHLLVDKKIYSVTEILTAVNRKVEIFLDKRNQVLEIINKDDVKVLCIDKNKVVNFIFFNLLMNAIKFSPDGAKITISIEELKEDKKALISVIDDGIGMTNYERENMYKPLFVGGNENHHHSGLYEYKAKGLGLGLTIVKNIIDMIQEDIYCISTVDEGTKITFTLPLE